MKELKKRIPLKYIYVLSACIAILLSVGLYYTYAMFTANVSSGNVVNMDTTLKYNFDISGTQSFHIGKNSIASFYATINNTSNGTIYYEIYYSSNSDLTNVIIGEVVEDKTVTTTALNTSGNIDTGVSKDVPLVIANKSDNDIDIIIGVASGYVDNKITYGSNGYPNGTKITSTYNSSDITNACEGGGTSADQNNCITQLEGSNLNKYCLTETIENVPTLGQKILQDNPNQLTRDSGSFSSAFNTNNNGNTIYKAAGQNSNLSYYFAGVVSNNYVYFANKYWRIVRINEDGSVRLIYAGNYATDPSGFISTSTKFNNNYNYTYYVGYKYGTSQHANNNDSNIKTVIDTWYTNNIKENYSQYISKTAIYCNDRNVYEGTWAQRANQYVRFSPIQRVAFDSTPSFVCNTTADQFTGKNSSSIGNQQLTDKPVALITADEMLYAGAAMESASNSYIYDNASSGANFWWSMSPASWWNYYGSYQGYFVLMFQMKADKSMTRDNYNVNGDGGVRPVLSLKSCVKWVGGDGTSGTPTSNSGAYTIGIDDECASKDN